MLRSTIFLWVIWFGSAFTYYGMLLLGTELLEEEDSGTHCKALDYISNPEYASISSASIYNFTNITAENITKGNITEIIHGEECVELDNADFAANFIDAIAELPGGALSFFMLEILGRKATLVKINRPMIWCYQIRIFFMHAISICLTLKLILQGTEYLTLTVIFFILCFCLTRGFQTFLLFVGRTFIISAFQAAYVFTPEVLIKLMYAKCLYE